MAAMQQAFQLITGYMASAALHPILKLGVPDLLAKGPRPVAELAQATGAHEDTLYRVLRTLASVGLFDEVAPHRFGLTAAGEFLRSDVPGSVRDLGVFICDPFHFRMYAELMHSLMTGKSAAEKFLGMPMFEYLPRDPELSESFNRAMTGFSAAVIPAVLKTYDFSGIDVLVDVAGGHGEVLGSILRQYPKMRGVLADLDHVIAGAVPHLEQMGVKGRCETVAIDFFKSVPAGGDAYIMKHIIHDWDDERAAVLLGNIRRQLQGKPNGRLLLIEAVIQPGNQPDIMKLIDMEMLAAPGGRERTADEFKALFARSGFELTRVVPNESPLALIEARPR
jgi:O-methyltransferase domain/Dimerisation domain